LSNNAAFIPLPIEEIMYEQATLLIRKKRAAPFQALLVSAIGAAIPVFPFSMISSALTAWCAWLVLSLFLSVFMYKGLIEEKLDYDPCRNITQTGIDIILASCEDLPEIRGLLGVYLEARGSIENWNESDYIRWGNAVRSALASRINEENNNKSRMYLISDEEQP
jgi:hypothetical protein